MNSKILTMFAITLLLASMLPIISAEIIWSNPVTVGFTITDTGDNGNNADDSKGCDGVKTRQYAEESLTSYGEWTCSGNRLQRTNIIDGKQKTEFGGACGLSLDENSYNQNTYSGQTGNISDNFIIAAIILIILILIVLVLIALKLTQLKY